MNSDKKIQYLQNKIQSMLFSVYHKSADYAPLSSPQPAPRHPANSMRAKTPAQRNRIVADIDVNQFPPE